MSEPAPTSPFATKALPDQPDVTAPDGSDVRILLALNGGSMAHFELAPGSISKAVVHRTVEEIWFVVGGRGRMWRRSPNPGEADAGAREEVTPLEPGVCLTIPLGTRFQFRCEGNEPLRAVAITMPPWPGEDEAAFVEGHWSA